MAGGSNDRGYRCVRGPESRDRVGGATALDLRTDISKRRAQKRRIVFKDDPPFRIAIISADQSRSGGALKNAAATLKGRGGLPGLPDASDINRDMGFSAAVLDPSAFPY